MNFVEWKMQWRKPITPACCILSFLWEKKGCGPGPVVHSDPLRWSRSSEVTFSLSVDREGGNGGIPMSCHVHTRSVLPEGI